MTPRALGEVKPGDVVWLVHGHNPPKQRPGIVLEVDGEQVSVIFGTSKKRRSPAPALTISHKARVSKGMGLRVTTYFYATDVSCRPLDVVSSASRSGVVPGRLFREVYVRVMGKPG